jgi:hypothetical protein
MTAPKNRMRQTANITRGYFREVKTITEKASKTDKAGEWGLNAWVQIIHELVDLQVRTGATVLQTALAGPWWTEPLDVEPEASDPVTVEATNYPRTLQAASPFVRVGLPRTAIPAHSIGFDPEVLPAGAEEFRVVLRDYRFIGANYAGTVRLIPVGDAKAAPTEKEVIVGL